jgi:hypothetical protein
VPPLDPLDIQEVSVVDGGPRTASLTLVVKNARIHGMTNSNIDKTV